MTSKPPPPKVDRQLSGLRDATIRELQVAVELLTRATIQATQQNYPGVTALAREAAALSERSARSAGIMSLLED